MKINIQSRISMLAAACLLLGHSLFAKTYTTVKNGTWSNTATWDANGVPVETAAGDVVNINHNLSLNTWHNCFGTIKVNGTSQLIIGTTMTLTIEKGGEIIFDGGPNYSLVSGSGKILVKGSLTINEGKTLRIEGELVFDNNLHEKNSTNRGTLHVLGHPTTGQPLGTLTFNEGYLLNFGMVKNEGTIQGTAVIWLQGNGSIDNSFGNCRYSPGIAGRGIIKIFNETGKPFHLGNARYLCEISNTGDDYGHDELYISKGEVTANNFVIEVVWKFTPVAGNFFNVIQGGTITTPDKVHFQIPPIPGLIFKTPDDAYYNKHTIKVE